MGSSSYVPPIVEVYQEYRNPSAIVEKPLLSAVVVGPCFHIRSYENNKTTTIVGQYDAVNGNTFLVPDAVAGMKLVEDSVKVYADDAQIELLRAVDGAFSIASLATLNVVSSAAGGFLAAGIQVGDTCIIAGSSYKILMVLSDTSVALNKNLPFDTDQTGLIVSFARKVQDSRVPASFVTVEADIQSVEVRLGAKLSIAGKEYPLLSGVLYCAYKALDIRASYIPVEINSVEDVEKYLGAIDGDNNPLALGAFVTYSNAARRIYAVSLESNDLVGWAKARDVVKNRGFFAKAILSQDSGVISMFKALEEANQDPTKSRYGVSIGNHKVSALADDEVMTSTTGTAKIDAASGAVIMLVDNSAEFMTAGVRAGDFISVSGGQKLTVDQVVNENVIKVMTSSPFAAEATAISYKIHRLLENGDLAKKVAAISQGYRFKRVIMTFSDSVQIAGEKVPGYYLNCVVAGMTAGLPPHAGLSNKGAAVIEKVFNSNFKFEEDHLNIIAGGGTMIFVQDDEDSLPYIRHQLTTDRTTLETAEYSAVKNNDYISITFRDTIKKFLGIYNVQEGLFVTLRPALEADIKALSRPTSVELGPVLISAKILQLSQSPTNKDQVEVVIETVQPAPFNKGILRVIA